MSRTTETPMLQKILKATMDAYIDMTLDETKALNAEIKAVMETDRDSDIHTIAKMLEDRVSKYCEIHLP